MRITSDVNPPTSRLPPVLRHPVLWILLVGLLAMGGALRSDFYMDDYGFILNRNGDAPVKFCLVLGSHVLGSSAADAREITIFQLLPTLMTSLTNGLFPMNSAAAHGWNLVIHLTLSVLVFTVGQRLLRRLHLLGSPEARHRAALTGALLFACHPLGTEPVHYAKCHMVALVALFGFLATCEAAEFLASPSRRRALRCLLAGALCMMSYFPGTVLLGVNVVIVLCFSLTKKRRVKWSQHLPSKATLRRPRALALLVLGGVIVGYAAHFFLNRFYLTIISWDEYFPRHLATQGRVFWEYMQRIFLPTGLTSDHYQPWSTFQDPEAVIKLTLLGLVLVASAVFAFRRGPGTRRGISLLLLLSIIPFAIRLLYVNTEIMVEYRAYSALPWVCLLAGCGFSALAQFPARQPAPWLRWMPATAVIAVFTFLSMQRGIVWQSSISLAEDSLAQYPLNNRARNQLQYFDFHAGRYAAVLERHEELLRALETMVHANAGNEGRVMIDGFRANTNVISSFQLAIYARAELEGRLKALAYADRAIASLKHQHPTWLLPKSGQQKPPMWPLLEARAAVERMDTPPPL